MERSEAKSGMLLLLPRMPMMEMIAADGSAALLSPFDIELKPTDEELSLDLSPILIYLNRR